MLVLLTAAVFPTPHERCPLSSAHAGALSADPDVGGSGPVEDSSSSGICRTNATVEWELLHTWAAINNLGLDWDLSGLSSLPASCPAWGVECDGPTSRVISLDLSGRSFPCDGTPGGCQLLPGMFSLEGLSALKLLRLSHTSFAVNLNADLSGLVLLEVLDLQYMHNLVGTLDPALPDQMPRLIELHLAASRTGLVSVCLAWGTLWQERLLGGLAH